MTTYYLILDDQNGDTTVEAVDLDEAREQMEEWVQEGDYDERGARISGRIENKDEETVWSGSIDVPPDHEYLIRMATQDYDGEICGTDPEDHDWTSEGEGGCDENPGVWSTGGTSTAYRSHCRTCGLQRYETLTGSQYNPNESDTVQYEI